MFCFGCLCHLKFVHRWEGWWLQQEWLERLPVPLIKVRKLKFVDLSSILCIGKETSKKVVVLGGRVVGASSAMLILASCASLAF